MIHWCISYIFSGRAAFDRAKMNLGDDQFLVFGRVADDTAGRVRSTGLLRLALCPVYAGATGYINTGWRRDHVLINRLRLRLFYTTWLCSQKLLWWDKSFEEKLMSFLLPLFDSFMFSIFQFQAVSSTRTVPSRWLTLITESLNTKRIPLLFYCEYTQ